MQTETLLIIVGAAILAFGVAVFQYFYKAKYKTGRNKLYAILRFLSVFAILLLLINPKYTQVNYTTVKPTLAVMIDNSTSIEHLGYNDEAEAVVKRFRESELLNNSFNVAYFKFGTDIQSLDSLSFNQKQTNIARSLKSIQGIYKNEIAPQVLLSDGNQTLGESYVYTTRNGSQPIYPIILGDTIVYDDVRLGQINVNRYAYINNTFPVEVFASYNGSNTVNSKVRVSSGGKAIFEQNVTFTPQNSSSIINLKLPATRVGVQQYQVSLSPISNEKNTKNNYKNFAIEVIDQKTNVLLVSDIVHPDIGAIKKSIESNELRSVTLTNATDAKGKLNEYELVVLYQPLATFAPLYDEIAQLDKNAFTITGTNTDWRFLNKAQTTFSKEITGESEEVQAALNRNYTPFLMEDIGFDDFPPLLSGFGDFEIKANHEVALYKRLGSLLTESPLLVTAEQGNRREVLVFGEGLWRWRSQSFLDQQSFENFDSFIGNLIQYSASNKRKSRLNIDYDSFYYGNASVKVYAQYFDKNYVFDNRETLTIKTINQETKSVYEAPFILQNNAFQVDVSNLDPGPYNFTVSVEGKGLARSGAFTIVPFEVEQQFLNADSKKLKELAVNTSGAIFTVDKVDDFINTVTSDPRYRPVQKSNEKTVPLIDWKWLLGIIAITLATEWFMRKYNGLI